MNLWNTTIRCFSSRSRCKDCTFPSTSIFGYWKTLKVKTSIWSISDFGASYLEDALDFCLRKDKVLLDSFLRGLSTGVLILLFTPFLAELLERADMDPSFDLSSAFLLRTFVINRLRVLRLYDITALSAFKTLTILQGKTFLDRGSNNLNLRSRLLFCRSQI